jgi:hypothetical protein
VANPNQVESTMNKVHEEIPDERPTVRCLDTSSRLLTFASRVDRLCALALERLQVGPDPDAIAAALGDIVEIKALTEGVLR